MAEAKDTAVKFVAAFNAHDERALLSLHAAHIKFEAPGGVHLNNTTDATAYAMRWLKGFPNGRMTVRNEIVSGPWVIQEITMEGIHSGPLEGPMGIAPPTHKKLVGKGVQILRIDNGQVAEAHVYYDQFDFMSQLGLIPAPAVV
ncbi:MAG: ester cyclase [Candidatus Dormibacteraeota bacterium]|nr:ester cyclase [Candidatus Dormibacteraeota bacterium]